MFPKSGRPALIAFVLLLVFSGTLAESPWTKYETGLFWCNERFLESGRKPFDATHFRVAARGYIYVLAAALALQPPDEVDHRFEAPARLVEVDRVPPDSSGFEVSMFALHPPTSQAVVSEVIIAFAGTNERVDWKTNLGLSKAQYNAAREYVVNAASRYPGIKLVTTGYSLGGALAVHTALHEQTRALVAETWALNSSPRTGGLKINKDPRIWEAATRKDILKKFRHRNFDVKTDQRATDYYLVNSHRTYAHFRYVLTRNVLFAADLALLDEASPSASTEPLEILGLSAFSSCKSSSREP